MTILLVFSIFLLSQTVTSTSVLSGALNDFSVTLFNQLSKENQQENVIVSPFSVDTALSILLLGARSTSADELVKVLHFDQVPESNGRSVHQLFQQVRGWKRYGRLLQEQRLTCIFWNSYWTGTKKAQCHWPTTCSSDNMTYKMKSCKSTKMTCNHFITQK